MNEEADSKDGHGLDGKKAQKKARSARGGLPERLSHSARRETGCLKSPGSPVCSPRRPSSALCRPHPAPRHRTKSAPTPSPITQNKGLFLPLPNPGCPSHQESGASLNLEQVNEAAERKKELGRTRSTSLLPVLLSAR